MSNLKKFRETIGMTQTQLAKASGCARSYISEVEAGDVRLTLNMAKRFAAVLHQDAYALLGSDAIKYDGSFHQTLVSLAQDKFDSYVEMQISKKCTQREFDEFMLVYWIALGGLTDKDVASLEALAESLSKAHGDVK